MLYAMAATTLAGLATALGGALGALRRPGRQGMAFAMGFGAGVMLAVSLMDMLPGALGRYLAAFAPLRAGAMAASLVLLGLAAGWLLERALPEEAAFSAGGEEGRVLRSALVTALALVGHNLPEGAMTLFASLDDPAVGLRLAVAIGLHNLPEGLAETKTMQADTVLATIYKNGAYFLNVSQHKLSEDGNWNMIFDTEDAETEFVEINGCRVWVIRKSDVIQMAWPIENAYITLCGNLPWEEMEKIAEGAYLSDEVYVPSESSQSQEAPPESIPDFPVSTQYREEFAAYLNNVVRFFREPVSSPDSIPRDSNLAGFLLAETYRRGIQDGKSYPQDENRMYQIPNEEISATAEKLLGIENFDPAEIPEWPGSRKPGAEYQLYAGEESLPYSEIVSSMTHWEDDFVTVRAVISTAMDEEWLPDPDYAIDRFYTFQRIPDENGEYARLVSVQYAEEEPR